MKITCLSRFFCRFQTFRLYQEPRNELLMWWLVASAAVVRHITFFCCSCASCAGCGLSCGCPALAGLSCCCPALAGLSCGCPALFSVLFRGCPVVVPRSSQCPSRQTPCFRRQCFHVIASVSAQLPWPPTRECYEEVGRVSCPVVVPRLSDACECTVDGRE